MLLAAFVPRFFNFFGENFDARFDFFRIGHVVHAHALVRVRPWLIQTREEVIARHHQHATLFQSLIEQFCSDRQILKPQPQENRSFRFVDQAAFFR